MATEYGRLELSAPVTTKSGAQAGEIVIYRPTCRAMTEILDTARTMKQLERFVYNCCRALNGSAEPLEFAAAELMSMDGGELSAVIQAMSNDADAVVLPEDNADTITAPLVYTLQHPIRLTPKEDSEWVHQIAFEAKRVRDLSEYLDAQGETREFHTFMRTFGQPMGLRVPVMSDVLIDSLDFVDYLVIRRQIMGKLVHARGRWKKASPPVH